MSISSIYSIQNELSRAQAKPVVGPLFVSPIKALAGVVQTVACLALSFFLGATSNLFLNLGIMSDDGKREKWFAKAGHFEKAADDYLACAGYGLGSVAYSFANMATLGILGYRIETQSSTIRWPV